MELINDYPNTREVELKPNEIITMMNSKGCTISSLTALEETLVLEITDWETHYCIKLDDSKNYFCWWCDSWEIKNLNK